MARRSNSRRLAVEVLEDRRLMAGNILASLHGGNLVVRGDAADNQIQIVQLAQGLRVHGLTGTTVNGLASFDTAGKVNDVKVRMQQGGVDRFMIQGAFNLRRDLDIRLGDGAVLIEGSAGPVTIGGDLSVRTGAESDITLRNEVHVVGDTELDSGGTLNVVAGRATLPRFASATFGHSLNINNPYFPLVQGSKYTYEVEEAGQIVETIVVEVPVQTKTILGVQTQVVRDRVFRPDGQLIEDTFDWYAQDDTGNVWYLGEQVTNYKYDEQGNFVETTSGGSWEAGVNGAVAGVIMEANPRVGDRYYQEFHANDVLDQAAVLARGKTVTVPVGTFSNVLRTRDTSVMEPMGLKDKYFAPGLGTIKEFGYDYLTGEVNEVVRLVSVTLNGQAVTQVVPPTGFVGTNVSGRLVGSVRLDGEAEMYAEGALTVIEAIVGGPAEFIGAAEISLADSVLYGTTTIEAEGTVGLRGVRSWRSFEIESGEDVHIRESKLRGLVEIDLGDGDSLLAVTGSMFCRLEVDGGLGENTFEEQGSNSFGRLKLENFD